MVALGAVGVAAPAQASFAPEAGSPLAAGTNPYGVLPADFNSDGLVDLAAINGTSSNLSVFLRQSAGGFAPEAGSPLATGTGPNFGAVADFNADGRPDVAVANFVSSNVSVLIRQPGGDPAARWRSGERSRHGRLQRRHAARPRGHQSRQRHGHHPPAPARRVRCRGRAHRRRHPARGRRRCRLRRRRSP